jgi:glycosyltransferase involved in cell wall biosynthesis
VTAGAPVRPPVSGIVICRNEERGIARCLESLAWCDETVVVDSLSTDGTQEIARAYTDRVIEQPFLGYVKQKNFALDQARHDWVVCLDADEALSAELVQEIPRAIAGAEDAVSGFVLDRVTFFLGVWHDRGEWYPDPQLRVFRRSRGRWGGRDPHDRVELEGATRPLGGRLLHWNYRDLSDHVQQIDRFSTLLAREMHQAGQRFRLRDLLLRPFGRFLKGYVLHQGFRRGMPGFMVSVSTAYYVFMKYAKLWEIERQERAGR